MKHFHFSIIIIYMYRYTLILYILVTVKCAVHKNKNNGSYNIDVLGRLTSRKPYSKTMAERLQLSGLLKCPEIYPAVPIGYEETISKAVKNMSAIYVTGCPNKNYILTTYMVLYQDMWKTCSKYGMIPASIESVEELRCIEKFNLKYLRKKKKLINNQFKRYYILQKDSTLNNNFTSCVTGRKVPPELWAAFKLNNIVAENACVAMGMQFYLTNISGLIDVPCDVPLFSLACEYGRDAKRILFKQTPDIQCYTTTSPKPTTLDDIQHCLALKNELQSCQLTAVKKEFIEELDYKLKVILNVINSRKNVNNEL